jgi:hypothetical protein|nr:MAG TPA: hypothetical protein [Caudoviricetes sp.]
MKKPTDIRTINRRTEKFESLFRLYYNTGGKHNDIKS